jgi:4-carboxymuconolactone decarboxylase
MSRVPYPDPASLPEADRKFLAELPQLNVSRMLAGSPSMFQPLTRVFSAYLNDGLLDAELREIVILRTGFLLDCDYETDNHRRAAQVIGMSAERVDALEPGNNLDVFSSTEQQVIKFVDEVVLDGAASQVSFDAVADFMDTDEMIELTIVIGVYTLVSQFCQTFGIEPESIPISDTGIEDIGRAVKRL